MSEVCGSSGVRGHDCGYGIWLPSSLYGGKNSEHPIPIDLQHNGLALETGLGLGLGPTYTKCVHLALNEVQVC